ncbi:MAG: hypothetical protein OXN97_20485 [Bryobacterales bacterium]|nr:hypothetical protein [Bryobacterales bacterium]
MKARLIGRVPGAAGEGAALDALGSLSAGLVPAFVASVEIEDESADVARRAAVSGSRADRRIAGS